MRNGPTLDLPSTLPSPPVSERFQLQSRLLSLVSTQALAVQQLRDLYDGLSGRTRLTKALEFIYSSCRNRGRIHVSAIGKSGLIARKFVGILNSLGIAAAFLHSSDTLHGDLGSIQPHDSVILISASGSTHELISLSGHLQKPFVLITCKEGSILASTAYVTLNLPLIDDLQTTGVSCPTSSSTTTLVLSDSIALLLSSMLHEHPQSEFCRNHPGGNAGKAKRVVL